MQIKGGREVRREGGRGVEETTDQLWPDQGQQPEGRFASPDVDQTLQRPSGVCSRTFLTHAHGPLLIIRRPRREPCSIHEQKTRNKKTHTVPYDITKQSGAWADCMYTTIGLTGLTKDGEVISGKRLIGWNGADIARNTRYISRNETRVVHRVGHKMPHVDV